MLLVPAICLKDGQCVRSSQDEPSSFSLIAKEPVELARGFVEAGARRLHIVDLDVGVGNNLQNLDSITRILHEFTGVPAQVTGAIRDEDDVQAFMDAGVDYVIIGTRAVTAPHFISNLCLEYPGHVMVGLDTREGRVATEGWSKLSHHDAADLALRFERDGVESIVLTDIERDGMLKGIDIDSAAALARAITIPVMAAGGIAGLKDIELLCRHAEDGISGAVIGRALYDEILDFGEAQKLADTLDNRASGEQARDMPVK